MPVPAPAGGRGKRLLDLILILMALPMLVGLGAVIALAIRLDGPGPVLFRQTRIGRNGEPFRMVKFRTMVPEAEALRAALIAGSDRAGLCFKQRRDPRVTRIGRLLRRSSLDELPQIWNVIRGEMSLVGPRPALSEEVAGYGPRAQGRLAGLPGLTGLWQISGRADLDFDQMIELDLTYLARAGIAADLSILWRTLGAVATGRGAY